MTSTKTSKTATVVDFAKPSFILLCGDVINGKDESLSLIKVMDQVAAFVLPFVLTRCCLLVEFIINDEFTLAEYEEAAPNYKIQLTNPNNETVDIGNFPPLAIDKSKPLVTNRLLLNLASIALKHEGVYTFKVLGRTKNSDYIEVMSRKFPVRLLGGIPGLYKAKFATKGGEKAGEGNVILLANGSLQGEDLGFRYHGTYKIEEGKVTASARVIKYNPSYESIFGDLSEFDIELTGKVDNSTIQLEGCLKDVAVNPTFELTLERVSSLTPEVKQ